MMRSAPLLLALTVAGCSAPQPAACPADFDAFLARYSEDAAFQREFTAPVVIQTHVEDAEPETRTVTESKPADTLVYPALLGRAKREAQGLNRMKVTAGERQAVVTLSKEDTDYQNRLPLRARQLLAARPGRRPVALVRERLSPGAAPAAPPSSPPPPSVPTFSYECFWSPRNTTTSPGSSRKRSPLATSAMLARLARQVLARARRVRHAGHRARRRQLHPVELHARAAGRAAACARAPAPALRTGRLSSGSAGPRAAARAISSSRDTCSAAATRCSTASVGLAAPDSRLAQVARGTPASFAICACVSAARLAQLP